MNRAPAQREPSGAAYTMFTPQQVKQFKEAFNMMDQDGDGRVDEKDLRAMLTNLGESQLLLSLRVLSFTRVAPLSPPARRRQWMCDVNWRRSDAIVSTLFCLADKQARLPHRRSLTGSCLRDPEAPLLLKRKRRPASTSLNSSP